MMLRWTKAARQDRELVYARIDAVDPEAALRIDDRFEDRTHQLLHFPLLGRIGRVDGTRELSIPDASHIIVYRLESDLIWIVRIIHTAQLWPTESP